MDSAICQEQFFNFFLRLKIATAIPYIQARLLKWIFIFFTKLYRMQVFNEIEPSRHK